MSAQETLEAVQEFDELLTRIDEAANRLRRVRAELGLIDEMLSTAAARTRGSEPVSSIATVPDPEHPDEPVNSL